MQSQHPAIHDPRLHGLRSPGNRCTKEDIHAHFDCRQRMTRAEPGLMSLHRLLRSSAHASPSRALKRMSSAPRCIARCTAAWHAGARSSSLPQFMSRLNFGILTCQAIHYLSCAALPDMLR